MAKITLGNTTKLLKLGVTFISMKIKFVLCQLALINRAGGLYGKRSVRFPLIRKRILLPAFLPTVRTSTIKNAHHVNNGKRTHLKMLPSLKTFANRGLSC